MVRFGASDKPVAKSQVTEFLDRVGYDVVDLGPLADSWRRQPDLKHLFMVRFTRLIRQIGQQGRPRREGMKSLRQSKLQRGSSRSAEQRNFALATVERLSLHAVILGQKYSGARHEIRSIVHTWCFMKRKSTSLSVKNFHIRITCPARRVTHS